MLAGPFKDAESSVAAAPFSWTTALLISFSVMTLGTSRETPANSAGAAIRQTLFPLLA